MSKHKIISFIKSGIRLAGCVLGMIAFWGHFFPMHAFAFLLLAEVLGVVEEFYEVTPWPIISEYTDWNGTLPGHHLNDPETWRGIDSEGWKNGPDGASFGPKE